MSLALEQFKQVEKIFDIERNKDEGSKTMLKVIALVNELGSNFTKINGGELSEIQMKLSGYKFYLADYTADWGSSPTDFGPSGIISFIDVGKSSYLMSISPANDITLNYTNLDFECSASDDYGLENISLYGDTSQI